MLYGIKEEFCKLIKQVKIWEANKESTRIPIDL